MTSPALPGDRPALRNLLPVFALTAAVAGAAVAVAAVLAPASARGAVALTGTVAALLLCAAVTAAAHGRQTARTARARLASANQDLSRLFQERARLGEDSRRQHERLAGDLAREQARLAAELERERALHAETLATEHDRRTAEHTAELARLTEEHTAELARLTAEHAAERDRLTDGHSAQVARLGEERDRLTDGNARLAARLREATSARAAALSATANAAGRMQALATSMLADLRAMEEKHADEEVLADLLHLDHRTAQAGRLADSVAVLTGARSGRRWARPIAMESILRGAMGRIGGYQRVRVHSASDTAVAGHAAEGVMHALAELLDNAANFSPPTAEVHVYVEEVPAGVIVSVEDSGLVMSEAQLRRAEAAVSGETAGIGGLTGTRLGLAVVGRLARRYGMKVSYRPSARGGTGVLMLIPQDILVSQDGTPGTPAVPAVPAPPVAPAAPARPAPAPAPPTGHVPAPRSAPGASDRLPRRGGARPAAAPAAAPADATDAAQPVPPADHAAAPAAAGSPAPEPLLRHESADRDGGHAPDAAALGLPRRRRGRTLAEAERARSDSRAATPRPAPTAEETRARASRFSDFRQAVRGSAHTPPQDAAGPPATGSTAGPVAAPAASRTPAGPVAAPEPEGAPHATAAPDTRDTTVAAPDVTPPGLGGDTTPEPTTPRSPHAQNHLEGDPTS
ncbi:ATP-binding protein [Streptomyces sp. NPDC057052]|uniref:ATP-binding protein n=1 Tax=Streptomyces sp. NPDC057052 TaxID=3346010 RepID=UPI0036268759